MFLKADGATGKKYPKLQVHIRPSYWKPLNIMRYMINPSGFQKPSVWILAAIVNPFATATKAAFGILCRKLVSVLIP